MAYSLLIVSGDLSEMIPFITSLLIMYDSYKYSLYRTFFASIILQTFMLSRLLVNVSFGYISLWPFGIGLFLIYCSWKKYNFFDNIPSSNNSISYNHEFEFGLVGSSLVLFFIIPFESEINLDYLLEANIVLLSIHHMILGFKRDQGWRRLFGLIGLPLGLVSLGIQFGDLIMVLFLFLAALTLIGQAVLYSSKGGLGIGSTIEGAEPILSSVGLPEEINNNQDDNKTVESSRPTEKDKISTLMKKKTIGGVCAVDGCKNQHMRNSSVCYNHKGEKRTIDEKIPLGIIENPIFNNKKSSFKIILDQELIDNLNKIMIKSDKINDSTNWLPILRVHPNGNLFLEWEKI